MMPNFNVHFGRPNEEGKYRNAYTGEKCAVYDLKTFLDLNIQTIDRISIQIFDSGYFIVNQNFEERFWNCCVIEDIDYKYYIAACKENGLKYEDPEKIYDKVSHELLKYDTFLYGEISRSGTSFHFIFYYKCGRTVNNFRMCKSASKFIIKSVFKKLGYEKEIEAKDVYDDCTESIVQRMFMTKNKYVLNSGCTGEHEKIFKDNFYEIKKEYELMWNGNTKANSKEKVTFEREKYIVSYRKVPVSEKAYEYIEHKIRWRLFSSLSGLFGDDEQGLRDAWHEVAGILKEGNGHTREEYYDMPWEKMDWARKRTGKEYIDAELLKVYGYDTIFKSKENKNSQTLFGSYRDKIWL